MTNHAAVDTADGNTSRKVRERRSALQLSINIRSVHKALPGPILAFSKASREEGDDAQQPEVGTKESFITCQSTHWSKLLLLLSSSDALWMDVPCLCVIACFRDSVCSSAAAVVSHPTWVLCQEQIQFRQTCRGYCTLCDAWQQFHGHKASRTGNRMTVGD